MAPVNSRLKRHHLPKKPFHRKPKAREVTYESIEAILNQASTREELIEAFKNEIMPKARSVAEETTPIQGQHSSSDEGPMSLAVSFDNVKV